MADDLGAFLRHRRSQVAPAQVGLPAGGDRRVPGLRRAELAIVAGVSPDHYQRIEQGRVTPSAQVLNALATVLALDDTERAHLHDLARGAPARTPARRPHERDRHRYQHLVDAIGGPAYVLDHRRDLLAWNHLGSRLHGDISALPPAERNMVWLILTDPRARTLYPDWEATARAQVAMLRRSSGRHPGDPRIQELIDRLTDTSAEFTRWWPLREVRDSPTGVRALNHPDLGSLRLGYHSLHPAADPDLDVFIYYPCDPGGTAALTKLAAT